jgi:hypothetical protein
LTCGWYVCVMLSRLPFHVLKFCLLIEIFCMWFKIFIMISFIVINWSKSFLYLFIYIIYMKKFRFCLTRNWNLINKKLIFLLKIKSIYYYTNKIWYLFAIDIIDTQVARRGRQYHRNPPYKKRKNKIRLAKWKNK